MVPEVFSEAVSLVWPRVYGTTRFELDRFELGLTGRESGLEAVRPAGPGMLVGVVVDDGDLEVRVSEAMAQDWGVSFDDVLAAALGNAARCEFQVETITPEVFLVREPNFDPHLWLEPGVLKIFPAESPLLVATPMRGFTLVGVDRADTLTIFAGVMGDMLQSGQELESVTVCRQGGSGWEAVAWEQAPIAPGLVDMVTKLFADQGYARQKPLLEAWQNDGEGLFVAGHKVLRSPDGRVVSRAAWSQGVVTLLPVVDEVLLVGEDLSQTEVSWQRFAEIVSEAAQPCGLIPERFRVTQFPSQNAMNAIAT